MLKQITISTVAAIAFSVAPISTAGAKLATNGHNLNGRHLQGVQLNGVVAQGSDTQPAGQMTIRTVILPSGEIFNLR